MADPTYVKAEIDAKPEWVLAFRLSELDNDHAPIGWGRYIPQAEELIAQGVALDIDSAELYERYRQLQGGPR